VAWRYPHYGFGGYGYGGGAVYGSGVAPGVNYSAPAPAPTGGCLTKQELPDGSALFQDLCTQEQAESPPQGPAPGRPNGS
jgi:hypothetical protein